MTSAAPQPSVDFSRLGPPSGSRLLVVGGCGGIGQRLVAAALETGLKVMVFDLARAIEQSKPASGVAAAIPIDATDATAVDKAFAELDRRWDGLDCLVNLAGFTNARVPLDQLSPEEFDAIHAGSLRSTFLVARAALPRLRKAGGGTIVNTASGLATRVMPGFAPYASAKAGVIALTKAVAVENGPMIRANTIAPGATDTVFLRGGTARAPTHGGERHVDPEAMSKAAPLGRIGVADDIVGPILFLLGPASRFMTGQVLYINGGSVMP
jgi:3-oxoacyl-[acyl-carrier protein] reductase